MRDSEATMESAAKTCAGAPRDAQPGGDRNCLHDPSWVVDLPSRKVVRGPCTLCRAGQGQIDTEVEAHAGARVSEADRWYRYGPGRKETAPPDL